MKWWQSVMLAMLVWGNAASAAYTADAQASQDSQTVMSWIAHLNFYFPGLSIKADAELLSNPQSRIQLLNELQLLEGYMHGDYTMPSGSLKELACGRPVCDGGGDGGKCKTCKFDDNRRESKL